jgi:hypothetical protein
MHTRRENNKYRVESEPRKTQCAFFALSAGAKSSDRTTDVNSCMCGLLFSYSLFRRARVCVCECRERENWPWSVSQHFYYRTLLIRTRGTTLWRHQHDFLAIYISRARHSTYTYIHTASVCERERDLIHSFNSLARETSRLCRCC